jgi:hypothetical protein
MHSFDLFQPSGFVLMRETAAQTWGSEDLVLEKWLIEARGTSPPGTLAAANHDFCGQHP